MTLSDNKQDLFLSARTRRLDRFRALSENNLSIHQKPFLARSLNFDLSYLGLGECDQRFFLPRGTVMRLPKSKTRKQKHTDKDDPLRSLSFDCPTSEKCTNTPNSASVINCASNLAYGGNMCCMEHLFPLGENSHCPVRLKTTGPTCREEPQLLIDQGHHL